MWAKPEPFSSWSPLPRWWSVEGFVGIASVYFERGTSL